jgi:hypothetical protein
MIKEIMLVPLPRAASSRLISFFTFQISIWRVSCQRTRSPQETQKSARSRSSPPRWRWDRSWWTIGRKKDRIRKKVRTSPSSSPREAEISVSFFFCVFGGLVSETGIPLNLVVGLELRGVSRKPFMAGGKVAVLAPHCCLIRVTDWSFQPLTPAEGLLADFVGSGALQDAELQTKLTGAWNNRI